MKKLITTTPVSVFHLMLQAIGAASHHDSMSTTLPHQIR